jgi:hypothetical protein
MEAMSPRRSVWLSLLGILLIVLGLAFWSEDDPIIGPIFMAPALILIVYMTWRGLWVP